MYTVQSGTIHETVNLGAGPNASETQRSDYGCGTVEDVKAAPPKGKPVLLGHPKGGAYSAAAAAAAGGGDAGGDRRSDKSVISALSKWVHELIDAAGDHQKAARELGSLLMKPDIPRLLVQGQLVGALVTALTNSNEPVVQRQLLGAMQKLANNGDLEVLVEANAHHAVLGIAFTAYDENHSHVRVSAIRLLLQLAESDQGREWLTLQQTFTSLCTLARVLLENEEDPTHAVLVLDLIRKLLQSQEAASPQRGAKPPALQWMRRTSRELVTDFKREPTGEEVRHMLDAIESTLPSHDRATFETFNIFGFGRGSS